MARPAHSGGAIVARRLVERLGGRFSVEAGIDVDAGEHEVERWFLAATLFGTRISSAVAIRTYRVLDAAGVSTIGDAGRRSWDELVALLDAGGYTRYDFRTASRLLELSAAVSRQHPDGIARFGAQARDLDALVADLDALPGWGPTTIGAFLRELRGVWPVVTTPLDPRAEGAARHLGLASGSRPLTVATLAVLAARADLDPRDLEAALVRLALVHGRAFARCEAAGSTCTLVAGEARSPQPMHR
jgi:hypothetical protein